MKLLNRCRRITALLSCLLLLVSCGSLPKNYTLTIAHLNDTHSHLEPVPVTMSIGGHRTIVQAGGFARLQTLVDEMRASSQNFLLLHAGDAVQGTLYFTLFNGQIEFDFLNRLGVDAMTFGNHEFDRGVAAIPLYLQRARFPLVSSNIDFSRETAIAGQVPARIVKSVNGERIGIIGLTTETTPYTTIDVGKTKFLDPRASARREIAALEAQGINKIIALSHLGYAEDVKLAASVDGIDIIVGGHTHSLLGDPDSLASLGLVPDGNYPTEVISPDGGRTLVLQAWQWGHILGRLKVDFDDAGKVSAFSPAAVIPVGDSFSRNGTTVQSDSADYLEILRFFNLTGSVRIVAEDPQTAAILRPYTARLESFRKEAVATAVDDIVHGINSGPGPLGADSMLAAVPGAQVAILNYGALRKDLQAGAISVGDVLEVMPFANTLVLVDLSGEELKNALEEDIDFLLSKFGTSPLALPYVAGITFTVSPAAPGGKRVSALKLKQADGGLHPVIPAKIYRTVVNIFVAGGGDGFTAIKNAKGFRSDTGVIDSDAFREYLKARGKLKNPTEQRILVIPDRPNASFLVPRAADSYDTGQSAAILR